MPTHAEQRVLPYTPEQLFDLVADVERYPDFLPWCVACRIRERERQVILADLVIGFKLFRERFSSRVTLDRPRRIHVAYTEGPLKYLNNHWTFESQGGGHSLIDFNIDFEFHARLMQSLMAILFNEAVKVMVSAFEKRATQLYGSATSFRISSNPAFTDSRRTRARSPGKR